MAQVIWTEPALSDLDAIGDHIALQNPDAAALLIARIFEHVGQLEAHPESGSKLVELKLPPNRRATMSGNLSLRRQVCIRPALTAIPTATPPGPLAPQAQVV